MKKMIDPITREVLTIAMALGNGLIQMALVAFIAFNVFFTIGSD